MTWAPWVSSVTDGLKFLFVTSVWMSGIGILVLKTVAAHRWSCKNSESDALPRRSTGASRLSLICSVITIALHCKWNIIFQEGIRRALSNAWQAGGKHGNRFWLWANYWARTVVSINADWNCSHCTYFTISRMVPNGISLTCTVLCGLHFRT